MTAKATTQLKRPIDDNHYWTNLFRLCTYSNIP